MHDDGVSVIIASYQWPEALRISLASALGQTHDHIEILVIEDGPPCTTQDVVEEIADPRVLYHALGRNSGSQSGPNQRGLSIATYPWIAYLGHDDVWDPRHLSRLLDTHDHTRANALHSCSLMIDGIPTERAVLAGFSPWTPTAFLPPSSLMHRRTLALDTPIWPDPTSSRQPIDYLALCEIERCCGPFASSGEVTLGKIAAAWRFRQTDARSVTAHEQLLTAVSDSPSPSTSFARWIQLLHVDSLELEFPAQPVMDPGWGTDHTRRMRGLPPLGSPYSTFDLRSLHADPNWHEPDQNGDHVIRWTGPEPVTTVILDAPHPLSPSVEIIFDVVRTLAPVTPEIPFEIEVDGKMAPVVSDDLGKGNHRGMGTGRFVARIVRDPHQIDAPLEITITTGIPCCPPPTPGGVQDARRLGIAFSFIAVQPARDTPVISTRSTP